jgi:hypothetical protein
MIPQQKYSRCNFCGTLVSWLDDGKQLNPYLVSLGYKKSGRAVHRYCLHNKYAVTKQEVEESFKRAKETKCLIHGKKEE